MFYTRDSTDFILQKSEELVLDFLFFREYSSNKKENDGVLQLQTSS